MKPILKATVACSLLMASGLSIAKTTPSQTQPKPVASQDQFADLRNSKNNMTKEQAQKVEAGAAPIIYAAGTIAINGIRHFAMRNAHNIHKAGAAATTHHGSSKIAEKLHPSNHSHSGSTTGH